MFFKGIPWTAHLSEQTQTRPGERYQHAHKSSCFPLGQGKNQINKNVAAKFPFPAASPPSSLWNKRHPSSQLPRLSLRWKTFKVSLNQNISPKRGKQPHFPQKSAQGLFPQPQSCANPNLPHQQRVHPQLLLGAAAALGAGKGWRTRKCLSGDGGILEAAPNPARASAGARPWMAAGEEHQPSSNKVPPKLLLVSSLPALYPPFSPAQSSLSMVTR